MWAAPTTTLFLIFYSCSLIFPRSSGSAVLLLPESAEGSQHFFWEILLDLFHDEADGAGEGANNEAQNDPAGAGPRWISYLHSIPERFRGQSAEAERDLPLPGRSPAKGRARCRTNAGVPPKF